jgi:hypothetical protein
VLNVRNKVLVSSLAAIIAVPLFAVMCAASWFSHNSSVKTTNVDIIYQAKLANGKTLDAGNYRIEIPLNSKSPELKFYRHGKLVASVPARVKNEAQKPPATEIDYTRKGAAEYLSSVSPRGLRESFIIAGSSTMKSGA